MSPRFACLAVVALLAPAAAAAETGWSGPYVGLFAGYIEANDAWDTGVAPGAPKISPEGVMLGGLFGYAHDAKPLIFGLEADLSFPDFSDEGDCAAVASDCTLDVQILSSLRGRAGVALGPIQFYGTAGVALGFIQAESNAGASDSKALAGWTLGTGVEWQTEGGLRLGVEYRHSDYGEADVTFAGSAQGDINFETDDVRLRLSIPLD
jgi:outer membrane immunogenic protein